jgi:hypothetical protein
VTTLQADRVQCDPCKRNAHMLCEVVLLRTREKDAVRCECDCRMIPGRADEFKRSGWA